MFRFRNTQSVAKPIHKRCHNRLQFPYDIDDDGCLQADDGENAGSSTMPSRSGAGLTSQPDIVLFPRSALHIQNPPWPLVQADVPVDLPNDDAIKCCVDWSRTTAQSGSSANVDLESICFDLNLIRLFRTEVSRLRSGQ